MSIRVLYRKIPVSIRICSYYQCHKSILRNIDRDKNGHLYHHGCLLSAREERWRCLECYAQFDATEASFEEITDSYLGKMNMWSGDILVSAVFNVACSLKVIPLKMGPHQIMPLSVGQKKVESALCLVKMPHPRQVLESNSKTPYGGTSP
jgi:hypothetical protein